MEIKPLEKKKMELSEKISSAWYFETWFEKLILVLMAVLSVWKVLGLIFSAL